MSLNIGGLSIGHDSAGADAYLKDLNAKAITETKTKIDDVKEIESAFENGWAGNARVTFLNNFKKARDSKKKDLDQIKKDVDKRFKDIASEWDNIDKTVIKK